MSMLALSALGAQLCNAAVRIIENTPRRLTFEWTTDDIKISQGPAGTAELSFSGANVDLGEDNEPVIPAYSFYVGVPPQGEAVPGFTVTASHSVALSQQLRTRKAPNIGRRYPDLVFSQPWISNGRAARLSDLSCRQFFLRPFVYDPAAKVLQVLDKGVFTISFPSVPSRGAALAPPRSDFKRMVRQLVLNYDIASGWPVAAPLAKRAGARQYPLTAGDPMATFPVGDGHGGINEGTIEENGVIKIMGGDLLRIFGPNVPLNQIALYASYKGELPTTTPAFEDIPDGVTEVPMLRSDNGTPGVLDSSDYALAYVSGASDWWFDSLNNCFTYKLDRYTDERHYWIVRKNSGQTLSLSPMTQLFSAPSDTLTSTPGHYLLKRSTYKSLIERNGGLIWSWTILTSNNPSFLYSNVTLPFADAAAPCSVRVRTGYKNNYSNPAITLAYGGASLCNNCDSTWHPAAKYPGDNQPVTMSIRSNVSDSIELQAFEFRYAQKLNAGAGPFMTVFSPEQPGIVRYRLSGLGNGLVYIFRIGNNEQLMQLINPVRGASTCEWTDSAGIGIRYFICGETTIKQAPSFEPVQARSTSDLYETKDLRSLSTPIDYLVISHPDFKTPAQRLVKHKRNIGRFVNPREISISDVYNEFSGGNVDPSAVRNCLEYVKNYQEQFLHDSSFNYVVFMGAGHWDYRGLAAGNDPSFMPVAESDDDRCIEDFFVYLSPGARMESRDSIVAPSMFLGRMPCHTMPEADQMVDKVITTEDPLQADVGVWRNRMLLVNDDDMQGQKRDDLGLQHLQSSERVAVLAAALQPALDIRKVNEFDYPFSAQLEKPEASQAIINTINNGVAMVNYFGHGADNVWADEHVLQPENISSMVNNGKYPIINSFSCSVGKLDKPGSVHSLSEYLVLAPKGAAIAAISSTREAYAGDNEKLAMNFYASVLDTAAVCSYGQALVFAKLKSRDENQKVYAYLGDPSVSFTRADRTISLTIVNDNGALLDTALQALQQVTVRGIIGAKKGAAVGNVPDASYGSGADASRQVTVQVNMFNPEYSAMRKDGGTANTGFAYSEPGSPLFMGMTTVKAGTFSQRVLIPKNVTFDKTGVKLTAFAWSSFDVGVGCKSNIMFHGYSQTGMSDTSGPVISVRPVYTATAGSPAASSAKGASSTDKISASCPFTIEIGVFDSNGVDVVSSGPDEGLTYQVSGPKSADRKNINQQFQFVQGDYRKGSATITFDANNQWPEGSYKITVSAQDLFGNVSHTTVDLDIVGEQELALYHVFNYPNPMRLGDVCRFYFDLSMATVQQTSDDVRVMIRLFTLSGRLVRVIQNAARGQVFDGRDSFGHLLSPGVYLYQISAANQNKVVKSKIEKLAINPPR